MGNRESLLAWSASFLQNRPQQDVDGNSSNPLPVLSGVPQGTVLCPLFFLIYINDIDKNLSPGTKIRLFADDSLLREITDISNSQTLQKDINTLQHWESHNKMEFQPRDVHSHAFHTQTRSHFIHIQHPWNKPRLTELCQVPWNYTRHQTRLERTYQLRL